MKYWKLSKGMYGWFIVTDESMPVIISHNMLLCAEAEQIIDAHNTAMNEFIEYMHNGVNDLFDSARQSASDTLYVNTIDNLLR